MASNFFLVYYFLRSVSFLFLHLLSSPCLFREENQVNVWPCATGASRKQIATRVDFYAHSYNEGRIAAALDLVRPIDKMILRIASSMHSYTELCIL